ncbi:MAG: sensor histidine kinase [Acutalibacteraceae bacterium]
MKRTIFDQLQWKLIGKLLLRFLLFNGGFWGLVVSILVVDRLFHFLYTGTTLLIVLATLYVVGTAVCLYSVFLTAARYLETVEDGISAVTARQPLPLFPSDLRAAESALRNLQTGLYEQERSAREAEQRKNDLVVYLAHDLKTPLTSVIGYLSLMEESPDLPVEQRAKYTAITLDKAYRLEQLINEFFDITRFNLQTITLDHNRIDLGVMLRQLAEEFYPLLEEKRLTVRVEVPREIVLIGDADKLARVFDNLLRNAVSYSYPDTVITLSAETVGGMAAVTVRNVGDEIPRDKLERVFDKFFRLDTARQSRGGGAGLGLAIAKQIVTQHGGGITAASTPEYTAFTITLPLKR